MNEEGMGWSCIEHWKKALCPDFDLLFRFRATHIHGNNRAGIDLAPSD